MRRAIDDWKASHPQPFAGARHDVAEGARTGRPRRRCRMGARLSQSLLAVRGISRLQLATPRILTDNIWTHQMSTFIAQVSASADDAAEQGADNNSPGTVSITGATLSLKGTGSASRYWAFRFENVTIPQGATISAAAIQVYCPNSTTTLSGTAVCCEAADNRPLSQLPAQTFPAAPSDA